jgi:hypothetical protein
MQFSRSLEPSLCKIMFDVFLRTMSSKIPLYWIDAFSRVEQSTKVPNSVKISESNENRIFVMIS